MRDDLIETIIFLCAQLISQFAGLRVIHVRAAVIGNYEGRSARIHTDVGGKTGRMLVNKDHPWNEIVLYWQLSIIQAALLFSLLYHMI